MMLVNLPRWLYRHTLKNVPWLDRSSPIRYVKGACRGATLARRGETADGQEESPAFHRGGGRTWLKDYLMSEAEVEAFAWILRKLELDVSARVVLAWLGAAMVPEEINQLTALLNFVIGRQLAGPEAPKGHRAVTLAADLATPAAEPLGRRNILFITGEFPNPVHGGGGRVADFIKGMSRAHNVYLYSVFDEYNDRAAYEALKAHCQKMGVVNSYQEFEGNLEGIREFIADIPMDMVHYEWHRSLTNYHPAWGAHHIFTFAEAVSLRLLMDMAFEPPLTKRWVGLMVELIKALKVEVVDTAQVDTQVMVTEKDGEFCARFNPCRQYIVLNHGVALDQFSLPDRLPEDRALTFVGHFLHYPNEDAMRYFFKEIFGLIRDQVPDVKVYVVGVDPMSRVQKYHDGRNVFVVSTGVDVRPYIQRACVCLAPMITGAGLRTKVIHYAALRRVCVATSIAAGDLKFDDAKEICIADEPAKFAERVIYLLRNPFVARRLSEAAYKKAQQYYDSSRLVQELYSIYAYLEIKHTARDTQPAVRPPPLQAKPAIPRREVLDWRCNICARVCRTTLFDLKREEPSCPGCGSSVRLRAIIHLLSTELFGASLDLPNFPRRPDLRGIGLSDWDGYAAQLARKLNYTNTFLHKKPKLDITKPGPRLGGRLDFPSPPKYSNTFHRRRLSLLTMLAGYLNLAVCSSSPSPMRFKTRPSSIFPR